MDERVGETMAAYDALADAFAASNAVAPADLAAFRDDFAARVGAGGRVADLGCGPGRDGVVLGRDGLTVVGLDLAHRMLLRSSEQGVRVVRGDLRRPPLRSGSLDGIWAVASLLHVPSGDLGATLAAWRRLLRPGGTLGLATSEGDHEGWEQEGALRRWFVHRDRHALTEAVAAAGFDVVAVGEGRSHRRWFRIMAEAGAGAGNRTGRWGDR